MTAGLEQAIEAAARALRHTPDLYVTEGTTTGAEALAAQIAVTAALAVQEPIIRAQVRAEVAELIQALRDDALRYYQAADGVDAGEEYWSGKADGLSAALSITAREHAAPDHTTVDGE